MGWDNFKRKLSKNIYNILIYYKMLFQKLRQGLGVPLFTKHNAQNNSSLFRKGYNTVQKIATGIDNVGNYAKVLAAPASMYNPVLGSITGVVGADSPFISKTLKDVVSNEKSTKKSIEKAWPQKTKDIFIFYGNLITQFLFFYGNFVNQFF